MFRRLCILFVLGALWPGLALAQSAALMEAFNKYQALDAQGRYAEAEPFARKALELSKKEFGPDHPQTGALLNNVALLYEAQGCYAEAEPLIRRSLAIREKALGPSFRPRWRCPDQPREEARRRALVAFRVSPACGSLQSRGEKS